MGMIWCFFFFFFIFIRFSNSNLNPISYISYSRDWILARQSFKTKLVEPGSYLDSPPPWGSSASQSGWSEVAVGNSCLKVCCSGFKTSMCVSAHNVCFINKTKKKGKKINFKKLKCSKIWKTNLPLYLYLQPLPQIACITFFSFFFKRPTLIVGPFSL